MKGKQAIALLCAAMGIISAASCDKADIREASSAAEMPAAEGLQSESTEPDRGELSEEELIERRFNEQLLANEKNTAANGIIIINDPEDYPESLKNAVVPYMDEQEHLYGYCDLSGNILQKPRYDYAQSFVGGVTFVCENNVYYMIDKSLDRVSENVYDDASCFANGTALVTKDSETYCVNEAEERVESAYFGDFYLSEKLWGYNDNKFDGELYMPFTENSIGSSPSEYGCVKYRDKDGNILAEFDSCQSCSAFSGGYAFLGDTIINSDFQIVGSMNYFDNESEVFSGYIPLGYGELTNINVYDGGYFIAVNYFETDLSKKFKVLKIAPELYSG